MNFGPSWETMHKRLYYRQILRAAQQYNANLRGSYRVVLKRCRSCLILQRIYTRKIFSLSQDQNFLNSVDPEANKFSWWKTLSSFTNIIKNRVKFIRKQTPKEIFALFLFSVVKPNVSVDLFLPIDNTRSERREHVNSHVSSTRCRFDQRRGRAFKRVLSRVVIFLNRTSGGGDAASRLAFSGGIRKKWRQRQGRWKRPHRWRIARHPQT